MWIYSNSPSELCLIPLWNGTTAASGSSHTWCFTRCNSVSLCALGSVRRKTPPRTSKGLGEILGGDVLEICICNHLRSSRRMFMTQRSRGDRWCPGLKVEGSRCAGTGPTRPFIRPRTCHHAAPSRFSPVQVEQIHQQKEPNSEYKQVFTSFESNETGKNKHRKCTERKFLSFTETFTQINTKNQTMLWLTEMWFTC